MKKTRKFSVPGVIPSLVALTSVVGLAFLSLAALRSPLFRVQAVSVSMTPRPDGGEQPWIDEQQILDWAAVPIDRESLPSLDLGVIEHRLRSHTWIREVSLQKIFPKTLAITVTLREPIALLQAVNGKLSYLDSSGVSFGEYHLDHGADLPLITPNPETPSSATHLQQLVQILIEWQRSTIGSRVQVASASWDGEGSVRILALYFMRGEQRVRTWVELGPLQTAIRDENAVLGRLERVFTWLSDHSVAAQQIWADSGKKIIVKNATHS